MGEFRENRVICVLGCTAAGKGELARALARALGAEVLSIDSMKVYRGMDVGTAKPGATERAKLVHHLIDVADPWESFSAARFVELADAAIDQAHAAGRPVVAVGGTVLYFRALHDGLFAGPGADAALRAELRDRAARLGAAALHAELAQVDPAAAARLHPNDLRRVERALEVHRLTGRPISELQSQWGAASVRRPELRWVLIGVRHERETAARRINDRVRRMVRDGLVDEARRLWSDPRGISMQARQAVGYAELYEAFEGRCDVESAIERIKVNTRRLAKQQRTWLRRTAGLRWLEGAAPKNAGATDVEGDAREEDGDAHNGGSMTRRPALSELLDAALEMATAAQAGEDPRGGG
ncbi:MAG: tRNA (adenosine(37)-N6)-dimethylallyltransferase MiaA [Phycisphaerales bacterium]|nr:tRNA (adenosine(37)-N6)-dimethylallyltransferase MiaA [Phycisphaerales bacterium]